MKENFWTMLKVLIALAVSVFIFNYFKGDFTSNVPQSSLINSSLEMLNSILSESVNNNETGENARRSFRTFSEKVSKGEIAPEEFQDVAAAILNIRMEEGINIDSELKKIILDMEFAQKEAELNKLSGNALNEKYVSIALKIEELAAFQEENLLNLTLNGLRSKVAPPSEPRASKKNRNLEIVIAFEQVEPISESSTSTNTRRESNITIIESPPIVVPLIKITDNLDVVVDSMIMIHLDSMKVIHLKQSLERLKHSKRLKSRKTKTIDGKTDSGQPDN